jgi:hypothetical protein
MFSQFAKGDRYKLIPKEELGEMTKTQILDILLENANFIQHKVINYTTHKNANIKHFEIEEIELEAYTPIDEKTEKITLLAYHMFYKDPEHKIVDIRKKLKKTFDKYFKQVEAYMDFIFEEQEINGVNNFDYVIEHFGEKPKKMFTEVKEIHLVDGFIMNGKSELLRNENYYDNEMDIFYRSRISDTELLPQKYYIIFELLGLYNSFYYNDRDILKLDRSFFSLSYFDFFDKENKVNYYKNLYNCLIFLLSFSNDVRIYIDFMGYPNGEIPYPFKDYRNIEQLTYKSKEDLTKSYENFIKHINESFLFLAKEEWEQDREKSESTKKRLKTI